MSTSGLFYWAKTMRLTFRSLAILAAAVCFSLAGIWLLAPSLLLSLWDVQDSYPVELMARRGAALFLGIAVMFLSARNAEPSVGRLSLVRGLVVGCLMLACLGILELATGHAGVGILLAVAVELLIAGLFVAVTRRETEHLFAKT
jgi:hypothetical protein